MVSPPAGLVVEVDGGVHHELREHDEVRGAALAARGYRVLHVPNDEVVQHLDQVLQAIVDACRRDRSSV